MAPEAGIVVALYSTWPRADGDGGGDGEKAFWSASDEFVSALVARFR